MNKYFDKKEYGAHLFDDLVHGSPLKQYSSNDLYMMASAGLYKYRYSPQEIEDILSCFYINKYGNNTSKEKIKEVKKQIKKAEVNGVDDVPPVKITQKELDYIKMLPGIEEQKVMFTLLCLAKYNNAVHGETIDWVSITADKIFSYANVHLSICEQDKMIYKLKTAGYLTNSMKLTSNSIHVNFVDHEGKAVIKVKDLRGLGFVYAAHIGGVRMRGKALKYCMCCSAPFIDSSPKNNRLYCTSCAKDHF